MRNRWDNHTCVWNAVELILDVNASGKAHMMYHGYIVLVQECIPDLPNKPQPVGQICILVKKYNHVDVGQCTERHVCCQCPG